MAAQVSIDANLLQTGGLRVEDAQGVPLVLMTVDARSQMYKVDYDDSEWTESEMRAGMKKWLEDPEGWGAPGMEVYDEVYDEMYGDKSQDHEG